MRSLVHILPIGEISGGARSWADFVASFRRTAAEQLDMLPMVGFAALLIVVAVLNWKIAKWLSKRSASKRPVARVNRAGQEVRDRAA